MKGIDKEQWRSTVALQNDAMKKQLFLQFGIITIRDAVKSTFIDLTF